MVAPISSFDGRVITTPSSVSYSRLASGKRTVRPSDDPASQALAASLDVKTRSSTVQARSFGDAASLVNVALGTIDGISDITIRQRELAVRAANGILNDAQRGALDQEYQALNEERDRISQSTTFNGQKLLDGSLSTQVDGVDIKVAAFDTNSLGIPPSIATADAARAAIDATKQGGEVISQQSAALGAVLEQLGQGISSAQSEGIATAEAAARISDVDFAAEASALIASNVSSSAQVAVAAQANIDSGRAAALLG